MLKITPYLSLILLIIAIGGLWYPLLGYGMLVVMATLMILSPFLGRWFCGNLCPRGSFNDFILVKVSRKKEIPRLFKNIWFRIPVLTILMGFMAFRVINTKGVVNQIGMVFVSICIITSLIGIFFGAIFSPRAWCTFCPMGTVQRYFGSNKHVLKAHKSKCNNCKICEKVCPMQIKVNEIIHDPDCIKCGRCIKACPKKVLHF